MYTILKSLVRSSRVGAKWEEIDISQMLVVDIYNKYRQIILVLKTEDDVEHIIDMDQLKPEYAQYTATLSLLIQSLAGRGFETLPELPSKNVKYAKFVNATQAGYHMELAKAGFATTKDTPVELKPDVFIYRDRDADLSDLHKYALVTANGYIHQTEAINGKVYVKDAGKNMRYSQDNHIGVLSFFEFGEISKLSLTDSMIGLSEGNDNLKERVKITVPPGFEDKQAILILGGYMVPPEALAFWRGGDREYYVDLKRLSYIDRVLESQLYLDMSHLQLTSSLVNYRNINIEEVWSDAVIRRYFTMSQSFMVFLDIKELTFDRIYVRQMLVPGQFTAYEEPVYPFFLGSGRIADYWKIREGKRWSMKMTDSYRRLWMHHRENETALKNVFDQLSFDVPYHFSQGFLLEIGGYS